MILAVDIGNSSICLGVYELHGDRSHLAFKAKISSDRYKSADEYAVLLGGIFAMKRLPTSDVEGAIMLSVVPALTHTLTAALRSFGIEPMIVGSGIKTGLNIRVDTPNLLGADIVADTVGALRIAEPPLVVIDLGTATTITAINPRGELCGCIIAPGVRLSLDALSEKCALLPEVSLTAPEKLLGTNTSDCMNSGSVYGTALMLDGFIGRIRREFSIGDELSIIATGGLSGLIIPLCENEIRREPDLTLNGLCRLYEINTRQRRR